MIKKYQKNEFFNKKLIIFKIYIYKKINIINYKFLLKNVKKTSKMIKI
jgi:hypothetical protein